LSDLQKPAADWELQFMVAGCAEKGLPIEILGSGSKRAIGRPIESAITITTASLRGITLYEPSELVMSARAGTLLSHVEAELAAHGQMLAFEPIDVAPAVGGPQGMQTIGAVFATNLSGARRIQAGAARDHLLGVRGVNGRAELFHAGGRVMKNVTGYDVARGITGSWGTLAVLTEVTFKVVPWPETAATIVFLGLPDNLAVELLCAAMAQPVEVSGAVHLQASVAARLGHSGLKTMGKAVTALRIENFQAAVAGRKLKLKEALKVYGKALELDHRESLEFWGELRRLSVMPNRQTLLWRISTKPMTAPKLVAAIKRYMPADAFYDWAGGLIWLEVPATADAGTAEIRRAAAVHGGHATLIRAEPTVRAAVEVFQPLSPAVERLTRGLKASFDPAGILNPGRMYANV
jgi:glycolate dehydrogenase FAD-binding subunit